MEEKQIGKDDENFMRVFDKVARLEAELAEARKKPEPGEFAKKAYDTMNYSFMKNNPSRDAYKCRKIALEACDEIDRLTTSCKLFEMMVSDLHAELKAKD
ncbi:MAG: hypothetical protein MIO92_05525, partial [Methanosarcinaceae archaeon]|nr:hypothetical protein [Methanosarcinaceae archaeon]